MIYSTKKALLFLILVALAVRLPELSRRPMHTDEAVHAFKFADLLENGSYVYDPHDYHGPTLYYFSLFSAWIYGQHNLKELKEPVLRLVPVLFGVVLVWLTFILAKPFGSEAAFFSALFIALSPAFTFYSRYYIQEIILVSFAAALFLAGVAYRSRATFPRAALIGVVLAFLFATKETALLILATLVPAVAVVIPVTQWRSIFRIKHLLVFLIAFTITGIMLFTNFFRHPPAIKDAVLAFAFYLQKSGEHEFHIHPFGYYFQILLNRSSIVPGINGDGLIVILGLLSPFLADRKSRLFRFFLTYSVILTLVYCTIPYKTPWSMLSFFFGWSILAGISISRILQRFQTSIARWTASTLLTLLFLLLLWQTLRTNFTYADAPENPYTYAQPRKDVVHLTQTLEQIALSTDRGFNLFLEVIVSENDYWPLPWYLRRFTRVGWWDHVDMSTPPAPVLLFSPEVEKRIVQKLFESRPPGQKFLYLPAFKTPLELRPGKPIEVYVRSDIWNQWQQSTRSSDE